MIFSLSILAVLWEASTLITMLLWKSVTKTTCAANQSTNWNTTSIPQTYDTIILFAKINMYILEKKQFFSLLWLQGIHSWKLTGSKYSDLWHIIFNPDYYNSCELKTLPWKAIILIWKYNMELIFPSLMVPWHTFSNSSLTRKKRLRLFIVVDNKKS